MRGMSRKRFIKKHPSDETPGRTKQGKWVLFRTGNLHRFIRKKVFGTYSRNEDPRNEES